MTTTEENRLLLTIAATAIDTNWTPSVGATERLDIAAATGSPTVTVHLGEHTQTSEGLSTPQSPTSATAALGATLNVALRPANSTVATKTVRYSYSGGADATALTLTSANLLLDRTVSLPGGVVVTGASMGVATWAYPNIHGDVTYTIDQSAAATGPYLYDPYGQPLTNSSNASPGDFDDGWLGQYQRRTEHQSELKQTIEMGARPYRAALGRFLRVDPIEGGATFSNYAYVVDPVNQYDLTGQKLTTCVGICQVKPFSDKQAAGYYFRGPPVTRPTYNAACDASIAECQRLDPTPPGTHARHCYCKCQEGKRPPPVRPIPIPVRVPQVVKTIVQLVVARVV